MRHQAFDSGVLGRPHRFQDLVERRPRSQAPHAAVDLQMVAHGTSDNGGQAIELGQVFERVDYRGEIVFDQRRPLEAEEVGHHQDAGPDSRLAQLDAFVHVADRQPAGAFGDQGSGYFDGAVAVGVRLYYRHHRYIRADGALNRVVVRSNLPPGDFEPRTIGVFGHRFQILRIACRTTRAAGARRLR